MRSSSALTNDMIGRKCCGGNAAMVLAFPHVIERDIKCESKGRTFKH